MKFYSFSNRVNNIIEKCFSKFNAIVQMLCILFVEVMQVASHQLGYAKGWRRYSFFLFTKQFLLYHTEGMKFWPAWYFICFAIYLTTNDGNFISIPFIDLAIFSIQWSKLVVEVPMDQVPCKTIGISYLYCVLHTHMLTNAKSVLTFEIGVIPW